MYFKYVYACIISVISGSEVESRFFVLPSLKTSPPSIHPHIYSKKKKRKKRVEEFLVFKMREMKFLRKDGCVKSEKEFFALLRYIYVNI